MHLTEVQIHAVPLERFDPLIGVQAAERLHAAAERTRAQLAGRTVWNVNSTAAGGGVAEMLEPLLSYSRGAGIDARWIVIRGDPTFFRITKRLHNHLHGAPGDGGPLGLSERAHYEATLEANAAELRALVRPGDVVLLHDPQTAGLVAAMRRLGCLVVWRNHIGTELKNEWVRAAWSWLRPYLAEATAIVLTRAAYAPEWLTENVYVLPPSIDPFSVKNQELSTEDVVSILQFTGILSGGEPSRSPLFHRRDGSPGRVDLRADVVRAGPSPGPDVPLILQVSRWDRLKDMAGVMEGFSRVMGRLGNAQLALVGPSVHGVSDDPEGLAVLEECITAWRTLPNPQRERIQLVCLPMSDVDENAIIVNALQRHAAIVTQKSLAEGFGLTVSEAMWKARPVVATRVGGIQEQLVHGESGFLLDNPGDLDQFGEYLALLVRDPALARRLGQNAQRRALEHFLGSRHLLQYAELFQKLSPSH